MEVSYRLFMCCLIFSVKLESDGLSFQQSSEAQLTLYTDDGYKTDVFGEDCPAGIYFTKDSAYSCACVTGVWAFYESYCKSPVSILGGSNYCQLLKTKKLKQVSLLSSSNSTFRPTLVRMTDKSQQMLEKYDHDAQVNWNPMTSSFLVLGGAAWTMETALGKLYCIWQQNPNEFCFIASFVAKPIKNIRLGCVPGAKMLEPEKCLEIQSNTNGDAVCNENDFDHQSDDDLHFKDLNTSKWSRVKRQTVESTTAIPETTTGGGTTSSGGGAAGGGGGAGNAPNQAVNDAAATEDEDFVDPVQSSVKNNPVILDQLKNYLDGSINDVTGASPYTTSTRFPIFDLLDLISKVMTSTCAIVSPDHFKMAVSTFINIQTHSLQFREPYIPESTFNRIKDALSDCLLTASSYNFVYDEPEPAATSQGSGGNTPPTETTTAGTTLPQGTTTKPPIICEGDMPPNATHSVLKDDAIMNISMPDANAGTGFEPVIETVWKAFLNAHNYCYRKFSEFYNDHHTFTVGLLHFFTNDIQSIWYPAAKNGTYEEPAPSGKLYGGLIGDHAYLIANMDLCVAASRIGSPYPWLMARPPRDEANKWSRRRKRSTMVSHGEVCLRAVSDVYTNLNKPDCK